MSYSEDDFDLYPNDEDYYETYLAQIEMGLADPPDAEVARRVFSSYWVSPFDTHRQTTPNIRLPYTRSNIRFRLAGEGG